MSTNRFELEIVTIFKEQGLDAAVSAMQQKLRSISAPLASGNVSASDIADYNAARVRLQEVLDRSVAQGQLTSREAGLVTGKLTTQINELRKSSDAFKAATQSNPIIRTTSEARGQIPNPRPTPPPRPTQPGGATEDFAQLQAADEAYIKAMAEVTSLRRKMQSQITELLTSDATYTASTARLAEARDRITAEELLDRRTSSQGVSSAIAARTQGRLFGAEVGTGVNTNLQDPEAIAILNDQKISGNKLAAALLREATASDEATAAAVEVKKARQENAAATTKAANDQAIADNGGSQIGQGGRIDQRLSAYEKTRRGGGVVDPLAQQTFGQQFLQLGVRTADYALAGSALYAGTQALHSMYTETVELDKQFALLKQQFNSLGEGSQFPAFRSQILEISQSTGVAANEVANVAFQLKGAFGDSTLAINNTRAAMQLVAVSGLSIDEVTNSMTATAVAYGVSFADVADKVEGLRQRYGVLEAQSVTAFGTAAAAAKEAGLSFSQVGEIIGAVGRASGQSADTIGSSIGRILPNLSKNSKAIEAAYSTAAKENLVSAQQAQAITDDFSSNQSGKALIQILQDQKKSAVLRSELVPLVAGTSRDLPTTSAIFQSSADILQPRDDTGALQKRFDSYTSSITLKLKELEEKMRQIGVGLANSGLLTALKYLAGGLILVVDVLGEAVSLLTSFDSALGHIPSDLLAVVIALKLVKAATTGLTSLGGVVSDIVGGSSARAAKQAASQVAIEQALNTQGFTDGLSRTAGTTAAVDASMAESEAAAKEAGTAIEAESISFEERIGVGLNEGATAIVAGIQSTVATVVARLAQVGTIVPGVGGAGVGVAKAGAGVAEAEAGTGVAGGAGAGAIIGTSGIVAPIVGAVVAAAVIGAGYVADKVYNDAKKQGATADVKRRQLQNQLASQTSNQIGQESAAGQFGPKVRINAGQTTPQGDIAQFTGLYPTTAAGVTAGQSASANRITDLETAVQLGLVADNKATGDLITRLKKAKGDGPAGAQAQNILNDLQNNNASGYKKLQDAITEQAQAAVIALGTPEQQYAAGQIDFNNAVAQAKTALDAAAAAVKPGDAPSLAAYQTALNNYNSTITKLTGDLTGFQGLQAAGVRSPDASGLLVHFNSILNDPNGDRGTQAQVAGQLAAFQEQQLQQQIANATSPQQALQIAQTPITLTDAERQHLADLWHVPLDQIPKQITDTVADIRQQLENSLANTLAIAQANAQAQIAGLYNPSAINSVNAGPAQQQLSQATSLPDTDPNKPLQIAQANDAIAQNNRQQADTNDQVAQSKLQLQQAIDAQDPQAVARDQIAAGNLALSQSRGNVAAANSARAQIASGQQAQRDANKAVAEAKINLLKAQSPQNALAQAQADQKLADVAAANAHNAVDRLNAQAQRLAADKSVQDALDAAANAQIDLLSAQAAAVGDTVKVAQDNYQKAQDALSKAQARGNLGPAEQATLQANVVSTQSALSDATLQNQEALIQFQLSMNQITAGQAAALYQGLLGQAPKLSDQQQIQEQIHSLQLQAAQDIQFNLPTELGLPTLYTARRLTQETGASGGVVGGATPGGVTNNDNRNVYITLNATNAVDGQQAVQTIVEALSAPPTTGTYPRLY